MPETSEMYEPGSPGSVYPECDADGPWGNAGSSKEVKDTYGPQIAREVCEQEVDEVNGIPHPAGMFAPPEEPAAPPEISVPSETVSGTANVGGGIADWFSGRF